MGSYRRHYWSRRACSVHFVLLLVLVLLAGVLVTGSRVRSKKHKISPGTSPVTRWQSRASTEGSLNALHESAVKPAPFSKPAHISGSTKRAYYVPTVTNHLENKLHHFINNLKTGIGASKLAHAVNGVTGAFQQQQQQQQQSTNLLGNPYRSAGASSPAGYYGTANELRYGQPFVSKQAAGHFKASPYGYGKNAGTGGKGGKRGRHPSGAASPGKYESLMSDLGISGYKHFENAVIRDLERREELKVEATIHTLYPEAGDEDWRPIAASKKPAPVQLKPPAVVRPSGPELSESKIVPALTAPAEKRPAGEAAVRLANRPKPNPAPTKGHSQSAGRFGSTGASTVVATAAGSASTTTPFPATGPKHRSKGGYHTKEKRTKERTTCWHCVNSTASSSAVTTRQPWLVSSHTPTTKLPAVSTQSQRFGPTYDAAMFYGSDGKPPATLAAVAQSYSNVEQVHYNRTLTPPFAAGPWTQLSTGVDEVSTQSAPPVTTFSGIPGETYGTHQAVSPYAAGNVKKSFSKLVKVHGPTTAYVAPGEGALTSTTTHKPTGGSQGTKGTKGTGKKRPAHKAEVGHPRRPYGKLGDSLGAGSSTTELRVKKKFDPKYSRNRGSIKFRDALQNNPDQIYR